MDYCHEASECYASPTNDIRVTSRSLDAFKRRDGILGRIKKIYRAQPLLPNLAKLKIAFACRNTPERLDITNRALRCL